MKDNPVLDKLMESSIVRKSGLKKEAVACILQSYNDIALDSLLENGYINLNNGLIIEVVQLLDRVHVLRGISYKSTRRYKLKLSMEESMYKKIEDYYMKLEEDIS